MTEPFQVDEPPKKLTEQEKSALFLAELHDHVRSFEAKVNSFPETSAAILFCGGVEKIAADFKEIFLKLWSKEQAARGLSKSAIKKNLANIENASRSLMTAKHTKPE